MYVSNEHFYRSKLEELKQKWDDIEMADTRREQRFSSYFLKCKADEIWNHVSAKVSNDAGFGEEVQVNNVSESGNAVMKRWQNFESKDQIIKITCNHARSWMPLQRYAKTSSIL